LAARSVGQQRRVEHFGALEAITQAESDCLFQTNVAG
jgi:hypothetical protein